MNEFKIFDLLYNILMTVWGISAIACIVIWVFSITYKI